MPTEQTYQASRIIFAPEEDVYEAMTDPEQLANWLLPESAKIIFDKFDLRPGGGYRLYVHYDHTETQAMSGNGVDILRGRFIDMIHYQQIVHALEFESAPPSMSGPIRVSWTVEDRPTGSRVKFDVSKLPPGLNGDDMVRHFEASLERLAALVEGQPYASIIYTGPRPSSS